MNHCARHYEEMMAGTCRSCGAAFCDRCLVYAFGPKKPPFCIGCALHTSGVRQGYKVAPTVAQVSGPADRRAAKAAKKAAAKAERARGRRGRRGAQVEPTSAPAPGAPIPFDAVWAEPPAEMPPIEAPPAEMPPAAHDEPALEPVGDDHDTRVPATAQLASLMRSRGAAPLGQPI